MEIRLWSDAPQTLGTVVATVVVYLAVLVAVRLVGRRTTAQLSAYDTLVTVALGTALATTALPSHPAIADGLAVLGTLLGLQLTIGVLRRRIPWLRRMTDFSPSLVVRDGRVEPTEGVLGAQLTGAEIDAELRRRGITAVDQVAVMVLEPSGAFSVLRTGDRAEAGQPWTELISGKSDQGGRP